MYEIRIVDVNEFKTSRDLWDGLVSKMNHPTIFSTWEWIYTWWENFGEAYKLLILFVYEGSEVKGILPLTSRKEIFRNRWLTGRILDYCGSIDVYPDHLDIIASKDDAKNCINAIFEFLSSKYKAWDVLQLSHLSEESNLISCSHRKEFHFDSKTNVATVAPFTPLLGSFEDYIKRFDHKQRYNIRRMKKKLYESHGIKYMSCDPLQNNDCLMTLFKLHEKRAKEKNIISTFKGPRIFNFHNALLGRTSKNGWPWLRSLGNEREIISVFYGFSLGGRLFNYQVAHDPVWEKYSPGTVLLYCVIEDAMNNGCKEFDFLRGNEKYKSTWANGRRNLITLSIINKTICGEITKSIGYTKEFLKRKLRKGINIVNVQEKSVHMI
jgi:CelD/BcsL family acetyltransferase involved in cellulose biosynthesis